MLILVPFILIIIGAIFCIIWTILVLLQHHDKIDLKFLRSFEYYISDHKVFKVIWLIMSFIILVCFLIILLVLWTIISISY